MFMIFLSVSAINRGSISVNVLFAFTYNVYVNGGYSPLNCVLYGRLLLYLL